MNVQLGYKFLCRHMEGKLYSAADSSCIWEIGKWKSVKGKLRACKNGFHYFKPNARAINLFMPSQKFHSVLAVVEVRGAKELKHRLWLNGRFMRKQVARHMRVVAIREVPLRMFSNENLLHFVRNG